jgi:hypothetical protein
MDTARQVEASHFGPDLPRATAGRSRCHQHVRRRGSNATSGHSRRLRRHVDLVMALYAQYVLHVTAGRFAAAYEARKDIKVRK